MMVTAAIVAMGMGLVLGLLGGGGSVLTVPLLAYAVGLGAKEAIATSLIAVAATSLVGAFIHARAGNVRLRTALLFGVASMAGAYGGAHLASLVSGTVLMIAFGALMVITGVAMLRGRKDPEGPVTPARAWLVAADGVAVGAVTGLVGAGGGFLIVPALVMLVGLDMRAAIGTSLAIIAMNASTAFLGHISHVAVDWTLVAVVVAGAVAGLVGGINLGARLPQATLKRAFGVFVLAMAALVLHLEGALGLLATQLGTSGLWVLALSALTVGAGVLARWLRYAD